MRMLATLAGDLTISDTTAKKLLADLPADLDPERRAVVETACRLVGKVNYFLGREVPGDRLELPLGPAHQGMGGRQLHHRHISTLWIGLQRICRLGILQCHGWRVRHGPRRRCPHAAHLLYPPSRGMRPSPAIWCSIPMMSMWES